MSKNNNDLFRKNNTKQIIAIIITAIFLISFGVGLSIGIYVFGIAGLFTILGVQYTSIWSLVIFVLSFFFVASIMELFIKPVSKFITKNMTKKFYIFLVNFIVLILLNGVCILIVDFFMDSINLSLKVGVVLTIFMTLIELAFEENDKKCDAENK